MGSIGKMEDLAGPGRGTDKWDESSRIPITSPGGSSVHILRLRRSAAPVALTVLALMGLVLAPSASSAAVVSAPPTAPQGSYDPDHVLVAFQPGTPGLERAAAHSAQRGEVENRMEWLNLDVVRIPDHADPIATAARYEHNPNVAYAQPNWEAQILSAPNDLLFKDLWGMHNTGQSVSGSLVRGVADADIDAPEGWDAAFGSGSFPSSGGTRVGILDTGIDLGHVDLFGKTKACANAVAAIGVVVEGACEDDNLHGTHVAGTIGAIANNSVGVAGAAPNSEFAVFKALNAAGQGFYADVIAGIHWLHTKGGAKVISMSIGGPQDKALSAELAEAENAGVLLIAAAGNDGDSTANYPAYHPDVMSVAATDAADKKGWFSNCNSDVEIAAPGVDVWSTTPGNSYAPLNGTSMATPHVSGVAAMIMSTKGLTAAQTRSQLNSTAVDLGSQGRDSCFGYGRVNLAAALGGSTAPPPSTAPGAIGGKVTDARSKAGIAGATVNCGTAGSATTSSTGAYTIANVAPGSYSCTASASGYQSKTSNVTVNSDATTTASFALRK